MWGVVRVLCMWGVVQVLCMWGMVRVLCMWGMVRVLCLHVGYGQSVMHVGYGPSVMHVGYGPSVMHVGYGQSVMHSFREISSEEFERISVKICTSKNFPLYGNRNSLSAEQNKTKLQLKGFNSHDVLICVLFFFLFKLGFSDVACPFLLPLGRTSLTSVHSL